MTQALATYHVGAVLFTGFLLFILFRIRHNRGVYRAVILLSLQFCVLLIAAVLFPVVGFARIQLMAWAAFFYFPIFLGGTAFLIRSQSQRFMIILGIGLTLILMIVVDAFLIEPHWLDTTHIRLQSTKISEPIRIAVLADIQTDQPGSYEEKVLSEVKEQDPDLILMVGDYLQLHRETEYLEAGEALNRIFRDSGLSPRLGIFAVRGNVDWNGWEAIFKDLEVRIIEDTKTVDIGPLSLTGIGWLESENMDLRIEGSDKYHIVMGHSPNFSLGEIAGDLLLAGHTHGGQVQLPGIGPILTLSAVPRKWASGLTEIHPDQYLLVSRGIGLERGYAPRMRFLCRPELIIIDLQPEWIEP